jgi:shikimate kinase
VTAQVHRQDLAHVLWLGGSTCAGKTSVAHLLAERHGLRLYSCDACFDDHRRRAHPDRHPGFCRLMDLSGPELCALPVDRQAEGLTAFYRDQMEMIVEDLAGVAGPVLAEGSGLLPELVAPLLRDRSKALWLIATPEFRRRRYPDRGAWVREMLAEMDDPEQAFERWMARDDLLAVQRAERAAALGLPVLTVDGSRTLGETAGEVAQRLGLEKGP